MPRHELGTAPRTLVRIRRVVPVQYNQMSYGPPTHRGTVRLVTATAAGRAHTHAGRVRLPVTVGGRAAGGPPPDTGRAGPPRRSDPVS